MSILGCLLEPDSPHGGKNRAPVFGLVLSNGFGQLLLSAQSLRLSGALRPVPCMSKRACMHWSIMVSSSRDVAVLAREVFLLVVIWKAPCVYYSLRLVGLRRELSQAASNSNFHLWVCAAPQERGYPSPGGRLPYLFNINLHKGSYTTDWHDQIRHFNTLTVGILIGWVKSQRNCTQLQETPRNTPLWNMPWTHRYSGDVQLEMYRMS